MSAVDIVSEAILVKSPRYEPASGEYVVWDGDVVFGCPKCGGLTRLTDNHRVGRDGLVRPSVVHTPCGWHVWLRLRGWTHHEDAGIRR